MFGDKLSLISRSSIGLTPFESGGASRDTVSGADAAFSQCRTAWSKSACRPAPNAGLTGGMAGGIDLFHVG